VLVLLDYNPMSVRRPRRELPAEGASRNSPPLSQPCARERSDDAWYRGGLNIAALPELDVIVATGAGHGVRLVTVLQGLAQAHDR
jgi:hypothetical protein